jgi:hypothetical protein
VEAFSVKYTVPNLDLPDLVSVDYSDMSFDDTTQTAKLTRIVKTKIAAPDTLLKLVGIRFLDFETKIEICRNSRIMTTVTRNLQFTSKMQILEECVLMPHSDNPSWTLYNTKAKLSIVPIWGVSVRCVT